MCVVVSVIRTSVDRAVTSATTGMASDGGWDNVDMAGRVLWVVLEKLIGCLDSKSIVQVPDRNFRRSIASVRKALVYK